MINREKTTLFFSKNTDAQAQETIKVALNVPAIQHYEKYLGLPSFVGRNKKAYFTQIKGSGLKCKVGRKSFYLQLVRK